MFSMSNRHINSHHRRRQTKANQESGVWVDKAEDIQDGEDGEFFDPSKFLELSLVEYPSPKPKNVDSLKENQSVENLPKTLDDLDLCSWRKTEWREKGGRLAVEISPGLCLRMFTV